MDSRFSPAIERLLARFDAWEAEQSLTAERILAALVEDEESLPATRLVQAGLSLLRLRDWLTAPKSGIALSRGELLHSATQLCRESGQDQLTSDVLLLAVIELAPPLCGQLVRLGFRPDQLRSTVVPENPLRPESLTPLQLSEPTELIATARVLDVGANRANESLRILDDYCRFVLEDRYLTESIKTVRHDLVTTLNKLPDSLLLESRETIRDVGTRISTTGEFQRSEIREVARVNFKRLQEAFRSLEEFSKLLSVDVAAEIEALRYRVYTLEQAIVRGSDLRARLADLQLYVLLTGEQCVASLDWTIAEAAAGGAQIVQLREKNLPDRELFDRARRCADACRDAGILFIMNDRPDIARLVDADGVHLGQDDLTVQAARQILGPDKLIGVSTHNLTQLRQAILDGASYVGIGPAFATATKPHEPVAGLEFLRQAVTESTLPMFAIGGINLRTIQVVCEVGVTRVAVSSVIAQADEPKLVAMALREALA